MINPVLNTTSLLPYRRPFAGVFCAHESLSEVGRYTGMPLRDLLGHPPGTIKEIIQKWYFIFGQTFLSGSAIGIVALSIAEKKAYIINPQKRRAKC